jgi:hypothetical protein
MIRDCVLPPGDPDQNSQVFDEEAAGAAPI